MKTAIIDLGSNTVRLSVYNISADGAFSPLFSKKEMAGLAGYIRKGMLSQDGIDKACTTLKTFSSLLQLLHVDDVHVFATASLRNIANTDEAIHQIYQKTGYLVDVISGKLEAALGYYGILNTAKPDHAACFDIGGGSTELVEIRSHEIFSSQSLSMGSLNLFNGHVSKIWPKDKEIHAMEQAIEKKLEEADLPNSGFDRLYGIGGTARAVMRIVNARFEKPWDDNLITLSELSQITDLLLSKNQQARDLVLRNCPDRVHTILPGVLIMNMLGSKFCKKDIFISKYGVREGYLCHKILKTTI